MANSLLSELALALRRTLSPVRVDRENSKESNKPVTNVQKSNSNNEDETNKKKENWAYRTSSNKVKKGSPKVKRVTSMAAGGETVANAAGASAKTQPDIHPELTLDQVQSGQILSPRQSFRRRRRHQVVAGDNNGSGVGSGVGNKPSFLKLDDDTNLEINTMFDYSPSSSSRLSRPRFREGRRSTWQYGINTNQRRSSIAVMAGKIGRDIFCHSLF